MPIQLQSPRRTAYREWSTDRAQRTSHTAGAGQRLRCSKVPSCGRDRRSRANAIEPYWGDRGRRGARRGLKCKAATIATLRTSQPHSTERRMLITISRIETPGNNSSSAVWGMGTSGKRPLPVFIRVCRSASFLRFKPQLYKPAVACERGG
jgi:hypothetical protein